MPAPSVFISYSHNDKDFVMKLEKLLKRKGARVWLDEHSMKTGDRLISEIVKGIEKTDFFVVVISNSSLTPTGLDSN